MLSPHFSLSELERTSHARVNRAGPAERARLELLCSLLLEPLREIHGPIRVTSGYRSPEVNRAVGGAPESAHRFGCAADIQPAAEGVTVEQLWQTAQSLRLPYDQCIWERRGATEWLHIALPRPTHVLRRQAFTDWR